MWKEKDWLIKSMPLPQALMPSNKGSSSVNKTQCINALAAIAVAILKNNVLEMRKEKDRLIEPMPLPQGLMPSNEGGSSVNKTGNDNALAAISWPSKGSHGLVSVLLLNFFCLCINTERCTRSWIICFWLGQMYMNATSAWKGIMAWRCMPGAAATGVIMRCRSLYHVSLPYKRCQLVSVLLLKLFCLCINTKCCTLSWTVRRQLIREQNTEQQCVHCKFFIAWLPCYYLALQFPFGLPPACICEYLPKWITIHYSSVLPFAQYGVYPCLLHGTGLIPDLRYHCSLLLTPSLTTI